MRVGVAELAGNIVEALATWWPASKCRIELAHLNPRFGNVPASQFTVAEQAVIETGMDRRRAITPSDVCEELQGFAAEKAMDLGRQLVRICEPEVEESKSKASGAEGATHDAAATEPGEDQQGLKGEEEGETATAADPAGDQQDSEDPQSMFLVMDCGALRASWGGKALGINQHADFTILKLLYESFGKIVYYADLLRKLKPDEIADSIAQSKDAPEDVKQAASHIRKALRTIGAPFTIENTQCKGYMMTNCDR